LPKPRELSVLTPSLINDLRECGLRIAFRLDSDFARFIRPTTFSLLGEAVHDLLEQAARGNTYGSIAKVEDLRVTIETAWDSLVAAKLTKLQAAWPLAPVPLPPRWPGYQRAKTRTVRLAAERSPRRTIDREPRISTRKILVEAPLKHSAMPLRGRADRIEITEEGTHIVDFKSSSDYGETVREDHRRQLLLYALMWESQHGDWPFRLSIQTLDGRQLSVDVDPQEAHATASEAMMALSSYNNSVKHLSDPERLAKPSADTCRYCSFRVTCPAYFSALNPTWAYWAKSVRGRITALTPVSNDHVVISLAPLQSDIEMPPAVLRLVSVPETFTSAVGAEISVVDACPSPRSTDLSVAWTTQLA
jgi:RecB family exonuclease